MFASHAKHALAALIGCAAWAATRAAPHDSTEAIDRPATSGEPRHAAVVSPLQVVGDNDGYGALASLAADAFDRLPPAIASVREFPLAANRTVALILESFQVTGPGATLVEGTDAGDVPMPMPRVTLFRGGVEGVAGSWVFLGVTPGRINGIVHVSDEEEFIIAPRNERIAVGAADTHVIYDRFLAEAGSTPSKLQCTAIPRPGEPEKHPSSIGFENGDGGIAGPRGVSDHVTWLAIDCDWEYRNLPSFASSGDAAAYALEIIGVVNVIYERDVQTRMYVNFLRVWTTSNDPYDAADTFEQLPEFENYFSGHPTGSVSREVNHLLSGRDLGGGRGFIDVLCDAYSISGNIAGTFPRPAHDFDDENWDIIVVPHEIGHNFGSPHTHCFDPPIDTCAGLSYDCPHTKVCQQGELMSYCHTCPGGTANIKLAFVHPAVIAELREDVSCLRAILSTVYVDGAWGGAENGNPPTPYNKVMKGFMGVAVGGTMRIRQGTYATPVALDRAVRLEVWDNIGTVRIGG